MNTVKNLLSLDGRVYVYVPDEKIAARFLENAQSEGFTVGDKKPTEAGYSDIFALNGDMTLSYPGFIGHMAFRSPKACSFKLIRVDYERYLSGSEDYIF